LPLNFNYGGFKVSWSANIHLHSACAHLALHKRLYHGFLIFQPFCSGFMPESILLFVVFGFRDKPGMTAVNG
jgi:hypothetical protein